MLVINLHVEKAKNNKHLMTCHINYRLVKYQISCNYNDITSKCNIYFLLPYGYLDVCCFPLIYLSSGTVLEIKMLFNAIYKYRCIVTDLNRPNIRQSEDVQRKYGSRLFVKCDDGCGGHIAYSNLYLICKEWNYYVGEKMKKRRF